MVNNTNINAWDLYLELKDKSEEELKSTDIVIEVNRPRSYRFGDSEWVNKIETLDRQLRLVHFRDDYK